MNIVAILELGFVFFIFSLWGVVLIYLILSKISNFLNRKK